MLPVILLWTEEKKGSKNAEGQIDQEPQRRKIDVEFTVVCTQGEDLEEREDTGTKDVHGTHIEVITLFYPA